MSVLIITHVAVENLADLADYQAAAGATMKEFGLRLIGKTVATPMLEGEFVGPITVVVEAESEEKARAWYASPGYAKAIAARSKGAKFAIGIVPSAGG